MSEWSRTALSFSSKEYISFIIFFLKGVIFERLCPHDAHQEDACAPFAAKGNVARPGEKNK